MVDDTANPHPQYHHPLYHHQQHELGDVVVDNDHDDEEDEKCFMKLLSSGPTFDIGQTAIIAGELSKARNDCVH
jgi:hypothetical protein